MLSLKRCVGQTLIILPTPELVIELKVAEVRGFSVAIWITAPHEVKVWREEIWQQIKQGVPWIATGGNCGAAAAGY